MLSGLFGLTAITGAPQTCVWSLVTLTSSALATELTESSSEEAIRKNLREFYKIAVPADSVARAIAYAIEQPAEVDVNEIVLRPIKQDF